MHKSKKSIFSLLVSTYCLSFSTISAPPTSFISEMNKCNNPWTEQGDYLPSSKGLKNNKNRQTCYRVSGQVKGTLPEGLSLTLNDEEITSPNNSGVFEFLTPFVTGEDFQVNVNGSEQQCELINEQGKVNGAAVNDLILQCGEIVQACNSTTSSSIGNKDLSGNNIDGIESLVNTIECGTEPWRVAANTRITNHRKTNNKIAILDKNGAQVSNIKVNFKLKEHSFNFGGVAQSKIWHGLTPIDAELYKQTFLEFGFNKTGFQNALKYKLHNSFEHFVQPMVDWFKSYDIPIRGHALIWPGWGNMETNISSADAQRLGITAGAPKNLSAYELKIYVDDSIKTWAAKWDVMEWDVANELRDRHDVQDLLGYQEEALWYKLAKESVLNSSATLFINDNRIISDTHDEIISEKVSTYKANIEAILAEGGPIEAIGFQSRFGAMTDPETIYQRLQYFDDLNLPISATEFEMKDDKITDELDRAIMTERVMTVFFSKENVTDILAWSFFEDPVRTDARHLISIDGEPNLRAKAWLYLVKKHWSTNLTTWFNRQGIADFNGFKGSYTATVSFDNYPNEVIEIDITDNEQDVVIQLPHYTKGADASIPAIFEITNVNDYSWPENQLNKSSKPSITGDGSIGALVWSLKGPDASNFNIDSQTGIFSLSAQDFETPIDVDNNNQYQITLVANDQAGNFAEQNITINIADIFEVTNYVPPAITGSNGDVISKVSTNGFDFVRSPLMNETTLGNVATFYEDNTWALFTWANAKSYCESIDARLPTKTELSTYLLPLVNDGSLRNTYQWPLNKTYWSSTELSPGKHNVMKTNVSPAKVSALLDTNKQYVSCIF